SCATDDELVPRKRLRMEPAFSLSPHSLVCMLLDVEAGPGPGGAFLLWGLAAPLHALTAARMEGAGAGGGTTTGVAAAATATMAGVCAEVAEEGLWRRLLVRVQDCRPYWFMPSPVPPTGSPPHPGWAHSQLQRLQQLLNTRLAPDCQLVSMEEEQGLRPIMYFRPGCPAGSPFLRLALAPGGSVRKAAPAVHALCKEGWLEEHGFAFPQRQDYEADVKPVTRFLCDAGLSGGGWLLLPPASDSGLGYTAVELGSRWSRSGLEVVAPVACLQPLTPDATQLADPHWQPQACQDDLPCWVCPMHTPLTNSILFHQESCG
ncbi:hypothetical protein V8C86DRAFT_2828740, partial [Haematococcus lacustris]